MTINQVSIFSATTATVVFTTKKGELCNITPEGALFKGGAAIAALKDAAFDSAVTKSVNGKYQAAADILGVAFPAVHKACIKLLGAPSQNKVNMAALLRGIEITSTPEKGWSKKQNMGLILVGALRCIPSLAKQEDTREVVEMEAA